MKTLADIRSTFIDYFHRQGHAVIESSPLVPRNDPTMMFTNSGMVQFKNVFTGAEKRDYQRATTVQKCVRAGGKHNDLENVGYTARHHTFFEMLGNFSFGNYFKEEAISFAWELINKEFGLARDKLLVTVYADDDEAASLWRKIAGFDDARIIRINTDDNFWRMGDTGPCGPCTEIFIDQGEALAGGPPGSADADGDRFLEFWNLVFMQFEQVNAEQRVKLPKPSVDTGMGLERFAAILQGVHSNFDIDLFQHLIAATQEQVRLKVTPANRASFRVIADHLRASAFLIADGVLPANEGRGYVLRRIMRRAMRHAHLLGAQEPLMHRLLPELVKQMSPAYPELLRTQKLIAETLQLEETRFKQTLERGLKLLDEELGKLSATQALSGQVAFKLYDTYGFPLDLTQDILRSQERMVDLDGFNAAMEQQRERARAAWVGSGDAATDRLWFELKEKIPATDFLGYDTLQAEGVVQALVVDGAVTDLAKAGQAVKIICNQTPFYGESGGQQGDSGQFVAASGAIIDITDTQKPLPTLFVHSGVVQSGTLKNGDAVTMKVDAQRRASLAAHHSATHLLHEALRRAFGEHVQQKGSLVAPGRLRFDVANPKAFDSETLLKVEAEVNAQIRANSKVTTTLMTPEAAVQAGAMALFGEKYGDEVRVVSMGASLDGVATNAANKPYSLELCGGTHVAATGDIGLFKIVSESAVAAGVRRIEAVSAGAAEAWLLQQQQKLAEAAGLLKVAPLEVPQRLGILLDERRTLEKQLAETRLKLALAGELAVRDIAGVAFTSRIVEDLSAKDLKPLMDALKAKIKSGVVAVVALEGGKAALAVALTADIAARFSAVDLVKVGGAILGAAGGGGKPDFAQAGGPLTDKAPEALEAIAVALSKHSAAA